MFDQPVGVLLADLEVQGARLALDVMLGLEGAGSFTPQQFAPYRLAGAVGQAIGQTDADGDRPAKPD